MSFYFKNTEQISEIDVEAKPFTLPKFGDSTTDPTYYEPMATAIQNMRNSAEGSGQSLYDFAPGTKAPDVSDTVPMIGRKPGLTIEEVSQINNINNANIQEDIKKDKEEKKNKDKQTKDAVELSQAIDEARVQGMSVASDE